MIKSKRSRSILGSFKEEERRKWNSKMISDMSDFKIAIGDDEMDELEEIDHRQARMLERGTGKLKKCIVCSHVHVVPMKTLKKWGWKYQRDGGYTCYFCATGTFKSSPKALRRKMIMDKVWNLYIERTHIGVKRYTK